LGDPDTAYGFSGAGTGPGWEGGGPLSLAAASSASQNPRRTSASSAVKPTEASMAGQQWRVAPRTATQHSGPMYDSPFTKKMTISLVHDPSRVSESQHSANPPPASAHAYSTELVSLTTTSWLASRARSIEENRTKFN